MNQTSIRKLLHKHPPSSNSKILNLVDFHWIKCYMIYNSFLCCHGNIQQHIDTVCGHLTRSLLCAFWTSHSRLSPLFAATMSSMLQRRLSIRFCAGHSSSSTPPLANHVFMECTGKMLWWYVPGLHLLVPVKAKLYATAYQHILQTIHLWWSGVCRLLATQCIHDQDQQSDFSHTFCGFFFVAFVFFERCLICLSFFVPM